ncbi:glycerophosphoryl diester phosphodiesterase membrane domain-containing protein [Kitasatospora sp. NPDC059673]|uniref:glycerophosphoryl diester phosphodiesterase membrane domain-containing protein n=1 Tax=Kitasatospora sp. NPDC059673 TaxID=3346901 RepID=UPI00368849FC
MSETPGWTSPGSPEPAPGPSETGHSAPPAPQATTAPPPPGPGMPLGPTPQPGMPLGPTPGIIPLRPLGLGELLDGSFALVRRYWKTAFGLSLVLACVLELVQAGVSWWIHVSGTDLEAAFSTYYTLPLEMLAGVIATGLFTPVIGNSLLGRDTALKDAWAQARPNLGRLTGLALVHTLIMIGAVAVPLVPVLLLTGFTDQPALLVLVPPAVVPALWIGVKLTFAAPALVLEKQGVIGALKRSWRLVRGSWWRVFGAMLVFEIVVGLLAAVLTVPGQLIAMIVGGVPGDPYATDGEAAISIGVMAICGVLAKTLTVPLTGSLLGLLYIDQRIRREALDIELARAVGLPGHYPTPTTAPVPGQYPPPGA